MRRVYAHLGEVRHRSEVVEYRAAQHLEQIGERLKKLGIVTGNVTTEPAGSHLRDTSSLGIADLPGRLLSLCLAGTRPRGIGTSCLCMQYKSPVLHSLQSNQRLQHSSRRTGARQRPGGTAGCLARVVGPFTS